MTSSTRQKYLDSMGARLGKVYYALYCDWASGLETYEEFKELYGTKGSVGLLNTVGPSLFSAIQIVYWHDLILCVTRLTDRGKRSVSIHRLPQFLADRPNLRRQVQDRIADTVGHAKGARDWRNRWIAHRDKSMMDPNPSPLAQVNLRGVKRVLDSVLAVLNVLEEEFCRGRIENFVAYPSGARAFKANLDQLVKSVRYIDSVIDPDGRARLTDLGVSRAFLKRLERK